ncbi:RAD51-associated protein 1 [Neosynchiropus ocellatus]
MRLCGSQPDSSAAVLRRRRTLHWLHAAASIRLALRRPATRAGGNSRNVRELQARGAAALPGSFWTTLATGETLLLINSRGLTTPQQNKTQAEASGAVTEAYGSGRDPGEAKRVDVLSCDTPVGPPQVKKRKNQKSTERAQTSAKHTSAEPDWEKEGSQSELPSGLALMQTPPSGVSQRQAFQQRTDTSRSTGTPRENEDNNTRPGTVPVHHSLALDRRGRTHASAAETIAPILLDPELGQSHDQRCSGKVEIKSGSGGWSQRWGPELRQVHSLPLKNGMFLTFDLGKTKAINYCDPKDFDDDEDDFACVRAPPSKKARDGSKPADAKKSSSKPSSQESNSQPIQSLKTRKSLDEKLLDRDLEAALALSLLNKTDVKEVASRGEGSARKPPDKSAELLPPVLSKFWEDTPVVGPSERDDEPAPHILKTVHKDDDDDDDYTPKPTPDSESEEDFSEPGESEDEEFTTKEVKKTSKKEAVKNQKPKQPTASKKGKQPTKPHTAASATVRSPPAAKRRAPSTTAPSSKPVLPVSPGAARIPKWTPPGQIGKGPASVSPGPAVKSPGQGLRLGLSRLVRVKPLHPGVTSH